MCLGGVVAQKHWHFGKEKTFVLAISTVALGLIVGASSLFLSLFLNLIEQIFLKFQETAIKPAPTGISPLHREFSVFIGGAIVTLVWYLLRTKFKLIVGVKRALKGDNMPFLETAIDVLAQIFYVGTGGSIGRELAPREAGALIAQKWEKLIAKWHLTALSREDCQLLIAAAAGAGFAGVYIAPLAGTFFCLEILLKKITPRAIGVSLTMSVIATLVGSISKGFGPYYLVKGTNFSLAFLFATACIAPICGILGSLFHESVNLAEKYQAKNWHILWQLPLVALATGLIAMLFPQIMGNGRALAQMAINTKGSSYILLLLFGALAKAVLTILTIRSGAAGGILTPSISIGAVTGVLLGSILFLIWPSIPIWQCAILGAVTFLAASQQAPLMALFMLIEISHLNYSAFLPLGLGVALSISISRIVLKQLN
ncbi:chloride channel protein [Oenococcus sp. UCMA 16435]|nr:chloride channel protein [Oenococcus sp. UCMA 16435]MDI4584290.1 chloride channel protein [Oenococcus sp. UCMA 14587]